MPKASWMLVVTPCSARKRVIDTSRPRSGDRVERRSQRQGITLVPAANLYIGQHHLSVLATIQRLRDCFGRDTVKLAIVSAGHGLLREEDRVRPYDATFSALSKSKILKRARLLGIRSSLIRLAKPYQAIVFLLSEAYLVSTEGALNVAPLEVYFAANRPTNLGPTATYVRAGLTAANRLGVSPRMIRAALFERLADRLLCVNAHGDRDNVQMIAQSCVSLLK